MAKKKKRTKFQKITLFSVWMMLIFTILGVVVVAIQPFL
ncbi:DUF4044 domain-containing protein [Ligilactobacillus saerimneri]